MVPHRMNVVVTAEHDVFSNGTAVLMQIPDAAEHEVVRKIHQRRNMRVGIHEHACFFISHCGQFVDILHFSVEIQVNNMSAHDLVIGELGKEIAAISIVPRISSSYTSE